VYQLAVTDYFVNKLMANYLPETDMSKKFIAQMIAKNQDIETLSYNTHTSYMKEIIELHKSKMFIFSHCTICMCMSNFAHR
jgi:hypothetical protein